MPNKQPLQLEPLDLEEVGGSSKLDLEPLDLEPMDKPAESKGFFGGMAETLVPDWNTITTIVKAGGGNPRAAMDLLSGLYRGQKEQFTKAGEAFSQGENIEGAGRVAAGMLPGIGPAAATAGERIGQGEVARGLGNAAGMLAPFAAGPALKVAGKVTAPARGAAADVLRESAVKQYSKVIGPTTKENKILTERVVPELLNRKVRALTRPGLEAKAEASAATASDALEEAYAGLPQDASVQYGPILRQMDKAKSDLVVKGTSEIVDEDLYKALDKVQQKILKIAGGTKEVAPLAPEASVATTRSARQLLDKTINKKTKIFGKTGKETVKLEAQKEGANAIRAELAEEYPDIAKINKEVNLWLTVKNLVGETNTRTASQATPLGERIVTAGGVAGGIASGGISSALKYATGLKLVSKLINSTAWRTVAAVEKNRLADLLGGGKIAEAEVYAAKLAGGKGGGGKSEPLSGTIEPDIPPQNPFGSSPRVTVDDILGIIKEREQARGAGNAGPRPTNALQQLERRRGRVNPRAGAANKALGPSRVQGTLPEVSATSADTSKEAISILDAISEKYKFGLPTKTNELIFKERDARGVGVGGGIRNWSGENVNDIPILQDVPHGAPAIERALRVRKGKVWDAIVRQAEEYVRQYKEEARLAGDEEVPF